VLIDSSGGSSTNAAVYVTQSPLGKMPYFKNVHINGSSVDGLYMNIRDSGIPTPTTILDNLRITLTGDYPLNINIGINSTLWIQNSEFSGATAALYINSGSAVDTQWIQINVFDTIISGNNRGIQIQGNRRTSISLRNVNSTAVSESFYIRNANVDAKNIRAASSGNYYR